MSTPSSFVYPAVVSLPLGYDCTFPIDLNRLVEQLAVPDARLRLVARRYHESKVVEETERRLDFVGRKLVSGTPEILVWHDAAERGEVHPSFAEIAITSLDDVPVFSSQRAVSNYSIYTKPGKKAFFSDNAFKYGAPPIISLMAKLGRFVEGYPSIHLDRARDCGETVLLINPYLRPILVRIVTNDDRTPLKARVPAQSVRAVPLIDFLREGETRWLGRIQLTANNRLITFHVRHSIANTSVISDHEHLDPFRTERTHLPMSEAARISFAGALRQLKRAIARNAG